MNVLQCLLGAWFDINPGDVMVWLLLNHLSGFLQYQ